MIHKIRIWDLPTRLFHWGLVLCVIGLFVTGKVGGDAMRWHFWLGYTVLALVLFRIVWGFVGGYWSRFVQFFPTPARLLSYLKGQARPEDKAGHNPLGAGSVFALLLLMAAQAGTGLFTWDEISNAGPLSGVVSDDMVSLLTGLHANWGQYLIIAFVALHVLAIIAYAVRKHSMVWPMIVGDKQIDADLPSARDTAGTRLRALIVLVMTSAAVWALVSWGNAQGTAGFSY
ncbi:MAG: cytochrome b/b6 domain-containing protein [Burkholderiaceae bacterium]|jgi:cytochrome b|nr:cytochrome b/b6 domain-containing protein [Burkholderiaceae bacterium]